jgi:formamidopyrimidine-DNA glycosylase
MPELPDLLHVVARLSAALAGRTVTGERVREPVVLRFTVRGNLTLLLGRALREVGRRSHWVLLRFEGLDLVVNPMLAGRFRLAPPGEADERSLAFALAFGDLELRYLDEKKMGKAFLVAAGDFQAIPGFHTGALDVLSAEFTRERFFSLLRHRRDQVRVFLLDKRALDSIGNAYADEVLFAARIHPYRKRTTLSEDDIARLYGAIGKVFAWATPIVAEQMREELNYEERRDFLKIHRRGGDQCPVCGTRISEITAGQRITNFCRNCQPN